MDLKTVVSALASFDEEHTIYVAEPWSNDAVAVVAAEPAAGGLPTEAQNVPPTYFLEVSIAKEFLDGWTASESPTPSIDAACARLIQYAINDA